MDQPKPSTALCFGSSSSAKTQSSWNPVKEAVGGLESKLSQIGEVLERAGWNGWIEREADEVWRWLENVRRLDKEIRVKLENWQPEIKEAEREDLAPAVKVLYSIPCLRSCIKRLKSQDRILLITKELREEIESGFKEDDVLKFNKLSYPDSESANRYKPPLTTCELRVLPVRGQKNDRDLVMSYFLPTPDNRIMISIMGNEGCGKTTLAQMVYNDERVLECFQARKWVCVSGHFDGRSIHIIQREVMSKSTEDLSGKRFLLVLDDVRGLGEDPDYLGDRSFFLIKNLLNYGAPGSVIMLTSRHVMHADYMHGVGSLSSADCWSIIKRAALMGKPQLHKEVRNIGRKFAEECKGSPPAANIVGDYLKSKTTAQEWEDAYGDEIWKTKIMGSGFFRLYERLSPESKKCFSYCAIFPKNTQINAEILVALWEAMGYIGGDADTGTEKQGYDMVKLLESSILFSDVKRSIHENKITSCKIREAYYAAAQLTSPKFTTFEQQKKLDSNTPSLRSFVIHSQCKLPDDLFMRLKYVKALVLSSCKLERLSDDDIVGLDLLQLLDLSGNPLKFLPEKIGNLKGLKSLYLRSCYLLLSIPDSIGALQYLRKLRINYTTDQLHNLPQGFGKLTSIRSLDVFRVGGTYQNIGKLKELNALVDIQIAVHGEVCFSDADLRSKSELENLELYFVGKGRNQEMAPCVDKLVPPQNLEMLLIDNYHGVLLPVFILADSLIYKLKRLSLRSAVNITSLPALWKLSSLEFLWLYDMPKITHLSCEFFGLPKIQQQHSELQISRDESDDKGKEWYSDDEDVHVAINREITEEGYGNREELEVAFCSLKILRIEYLENWEIWEDVDIYYEKQIKVMPSLEELIIADCPKFQGRPLRILRDTPWFEQKSPGAWTVDTWDKARLVINGKFNYPIGYWNMGNLELCFIGDGRNQEIAQCIEQLYRPLCLDVLRIDDYPGFRLPNWIITDDSIINNLRHLSIRSCPNISSFPSLWKLSHLAFLWLFDIPSMKHLGLEFFGCSKTKEHEEIHDGEVAFPHLDTLRIEYLQSWEKWEDIDEVEAGNKGINVMPSLENLIIADCPKLQGKPLRILRDTPWFKEEYKPSTLRGEEIEPHGDELLDMNDQIDDKPSASTSKALAGKASEIEIVQD